MPKVYIQNHFHSTTECTFAGCNVVTQPLSPNLEEEAKAANLALICETAGVSPEVATRFGYGL